MRLNGNPASGPEPRPVYRVCRCRRGRVEPLWFDSTLTGRLPLVFGDLRQARRCAAAHRRHMRGVVVTVSLAPAREPELPWGLFPRGLVICDS